MKEEIEIVEGYDIVDVQKTYKTTEAAEEINRIRKTDISAQTLRNIMQKIEKFVAIEKTSEDGNRLYSYDNIETIVEILNLKEQRNLTLDQTVKYLEDHPYEIYGTRKKVSSAALIPEDLVQMISSQITAKVEQIFDEKISLLSQQINTVALESQEKESEKEILRQEIRNKEDVLKNMQEEIQKLKEESLQKNREIEELKQKKRPLFGFGKK